jgi:hypothetical protein
MRGERGWRVDARFVKARQPTAGNQYCVPVIVPVIAKGILQNQALPTFSGPSK